MLQSLIPNFDAEMQRLHVLGPSGFIMGYGWGLRGIEHLHSTYPEKWRETYETRNYFVGDPILIWHMANTGEKRWSEIKSPDLRGVMKHATEFGLVYGAVFSRKTGLKKSFLTLARSDRELTDEEISEVAAKFSIWVETVLARASLTEAELAVLRAFRDGLGQRETAEALGIAESTVKQRAIRACSKLGAQTRTQAVAIAVQRNYFDV